MTNRIAAIGECMIELSDLGDSCYRQSFAGDTLNTAVYLSRGLKGTENSVSYVTAVGIDSLSDKMVDSWQQEGINCDFVCRIEDKLPGLYSIQLAEGGERSFTYWRNDAAAKQLFSRGLTDQQVDDLGTEFDYLYLSGISLAILDEMGLAVLFKLLEAARKNNKAVVFDNNYRPRLWADQKTARDTVNKVLSLATMALVTFDDEQALFGDHTPEDTLQRLSAIPEVVVKNGADGCFVQHHNAVELVPSMRIENVVDTTAAGDSFNGGYLAARVRGASPVAAAEKGHAMAAAVIQHKGAIVPSEFTNPVF
ncbi:sugar kinase [Endozoicomonas ascidiicola]|uniref:sugar kinase n=1 Tax=Endozoicomonas ascidiicola TaxID=1698521 RepID=UPI0008298B96|nr:sugar kinase [Endozoicomonas ascidiicola]